MTARYFVDASGAYLGALAGIGDAPIDPPPGAIEVASPPDHGAQLWKGGAWQPYVPPREIQEAARRAAYTVEADPLFFMAQRGEATTEEWTAKIAEIKARFPYPAE